MSVERRVALQSGGKNALLVPRTKNVGVRDDEVAIREELALGRSSGRKGDFPSMNTIPTASDTTTNIISQVSLPENCDWCEKNDRCSRAGVGTLNNFASGRLLEKLPLSYHGLCARSLTDGDFDHRRAGSW